MVRKILIVRYLFGTNVAVDFTHALVQNSETSEYEVLPVDTADYNYKNCQVTLPIYSEDCTFNAKRFRMSTELADDVVSSTHKNCVFNSLESAQEVIFRVSYPRQNDKRKSFKLAFDTCEFDKVNFYSYFQGYGDEYKAFKAYISFDSSKIGGKAVSSKSTDLIYNVNNEGYWDDEASKWVYSTETIYTIDGTNYKPVNEEDKWYLVAIE